MRNLKTMGLAAVAATALMAFIGASTASATVLCSANENPCSSANKWPKGAVIRFSLRSGTSVKLVDTEGESLDTCTGSSIEGNTSAGSATTTTSAAVTSLTWSGCTFTTDTILLNSLQIHVSGTGPNGSVSVGTEFRVTINTVLFGSCTYAFVFSKSFGSLTGGGEKEATLTMNTVVQRLSGSNLFCPETAKWTGEYVWTGSTALFAAVS